MYELIKIEDSNFIFSPFKNLETASLGIFLKIGSRFEEKNLRGISHFLEHMVFKGTKNYSHLQIKSEIEGRGGSLNGYTSEENCGYYAFFLNKNLEVTLDILLDMVFSPLLKEEDLEKERNVILEEIKMYNDIPSSRAEILLDKLLWKDHPLGEEVIGNFSTVKRIKRSDLINFKNKYYQPQNMLVVFSGDFDKEKIIKLLKKRIKKTYQKIRLNGYRPKILRGINIKLEKKNLEQLHLCIGFRAPSYLSKERTIVDILNIILGANMSSRLFEEIREKKGLCYEIYSSLSKFKDSGALIIRLGLDKNNIELAFRSILIELKKLIEEEVSKEELNRAKDYLLGHTIMGLEQPQGRMFYLANNYLFWKRIYSLDEVKKEIFEVNSKDIKYLASKIFNFEDICISCVGDFNENIEYNLKEILKKEGA